MMVAHALRLIRESGRNTGRFFLLLLLWAPLSGRASDVPSRPPSADGPAPLFSAAPSVIWGVNDSVFLGKGEEDDPKNLPRVSLSVIDGAAYAQTRSAALLEISRSGSGHAGDLPVMLLFEGAALNGVDYELLPRLVVIPDRSRSALLSIRPIPNDLGEGDKAVLVKLASSDQYELGNKTEATVWIYDVAYHVWRVQHFGRTAANLAAADRVSDPDGDGFCNFIEYLFDLDPLRPDHIRSGDWKVKKDKSVLRTDFWCRYSGVEEFRAEMEYSTNLLGGMWIKPEDPADRYFAVATPQGSRGNRKRQLLNTFQIKPEMGSNLFLRIRFFPND